MTRLTAEQWLLLFASLLTAICTAVAGLQHWSDALTPAVFAAIGIQIGISIRAFFTNPNPANGQTTVSTKNLPIILLAAAVGLSALVLPSCGGTTQLPNLPQVQATTDKDVRAAQAKAYQLIGAALNVLDHADRYEATVNAGGGIPANVHQAAVAGVVKAAKDLDSVNTDIRNKVLTTYAAIKARVDPIIANLNALLSLTKSGGFDWGGLLDAVVNLLMAVTAPGVAGGVA